jgi:hypothetical protein
MHAEDDEDDDELRRDEDNPHPAPIMHWFVPGPKTVTHEFA